MEGGSNTEGTWIGQPKAGGTCEVSYSLDEGVKIIWDGEAGGAGNNPTNNPTNDPTNDPTNNPENNGQSGESGTPGNNSGQSTHNYNAVPFEITGDGIDLSAGTVYSYNGGYYVCIQSTSAAGNWGSYDSVTPNGDKWPYVQLKENATVLKDSDLSYENDQNGHFSNVAVGTIYEAANGERYILKVSSYGENSWCKRPEENGNWQKIG